MSCTCTCMLISQVENVYCTCYVDGRTCSVYTCMKNMGLKSHNTIPKSLQDKGYNYETVAM